jgi:ABC-type glycerol-3-phosphate transport system substrate-binding protein
MGSSDDVGRTLEGGTLSRAELMRRAAALGVGLSGAGALAAGASAARQSENITLNVWKAPHSAQDAEFMNARFAEYKKVHPNVSVDYRVTPWASFDETYTAAFASGNPPDLHYDVDLYFTKYAKAGDLVALDQKFGSELNAQKKYYDASDFTDTSYEGHVYGLPFIGGGTSFVWNKKLFAAAGLDPNKPPATWNDVQTYAKKLTDSSKGVWGYGLMDNTTGELVNFYPSLMVNYGTKFLNGAGQWIADGPQAQAGINVLRNMYQAGYMPKFGTFVGHDINTAFMEGKIAMMLSLPDFISQLLPSYPGFEVGVSGSPSGPTNNQNTGGIGFWCIATASKYPAETWNLAVYLTSPSVESAYCRLVSLFPARNDVHPFPANSILGKFAPTQSNYWPEPLLSISWNTVLDPEVERAISGQVSTQQALQTAAQQINQELHK